MCGNCCRNHGDYAYVYLADADVEAISSHLGLSQAAFLERHCSLEEGWVSLRMDEPQCPFLEESNRCAIYPVRPKQCRTWPFWSENLKEAVWEGPVKKCCPGIGQGRLHSVEEIERNARETEEWYDEKE